MDLTIQESSVAIKLQEKTIVRRISASLKRSHRSHFINRDVNNIKHIFSFQGHLYILKKVDSGFG
jgi:hypothetical protein